MTYTLEVDRKNGSATLKDGSGNVIDDTLSLPVSTPGDIIDVILDDIGVGKPQKEAFRTLFKKDWEVVEK